MVPAMVSSGDDDMTNLLGDILNSATGLDGGLKAGTIAEGLMEALRIGTDNAVAKVSKADGYLNNRLIKILLPEDIQKAESLIRAAGYGDKLDEFVTSMNKAAEKAAPQAKTLFMDAIRSMTFDDARRILEGSDNEATLFFKDKTYDKLYEVFEPVISESMASAGVTRKYKDIETLVNMLPIAGFSDFKLDRYVTEQALDGLFKMVAEEEHKIRANPEARVTDLLKKVFGS